MDYGYERYALDLDEKKQSEVNAPIIASKYVIHAPSTTQTIEKYL